MSSNTAIGFRTSKAISSDKRTPVLDKIMLWFHRITLTTLDNCSIVQIGAFTPVMQSGESVLKACVLAHAVRPSDDLWKSERVVELCHQARDVDAERALNGCNS